MLSAGRRGPLAVVEWRTAATRRTRLRRQVRRRVDDEPHRSPIALAVSADGTRLLVANQTAGTVSLVDTEVRRGCSTRSRPATSRRVWPCRAMAVAAWSPTGTATTWPCSTSKTTRLAVAARIEVGPEPRGVAIAADGSTAFVAVGVSNEVVRVDLNARKVTGRLAVGREPRGDRAFAGWVATAGEQCAFPRRLGHRRAGWSVVTTIPIDGDNLRQVTISADGKTGYIANMRNRKFRRRPRTTSISAGCSASG